MRSGNPAPDPKVSCLCVTEDRHAFMPWLLWNYDRQSWPNRELIIVDSSAQPLALEPRGDIKIWRVPHGTRVARKRNLALRRAQGEFVTWFDDDDWQHPHKVRWLVAALAPEQAYAGAARSWFVDLRSRRAAAYHGTSRHLIFNSAVFRRQTAIAAKFPEHVVKASDTRWMRSLARRGTRAGQRVDKPLFFWVSHDTNLSNPSTKRAFANRLRDVREWTGADAWADTDEALDTLAARLDCKEMPRPGSGSALQPLPPRALQAATR